MPKGGALSGLRSAMTVDVTAPLPKQNDPWPANIADILIGSPGRPPTGFVTDPGAVPGTIPVNYSDTYNRFADEAPELARRSSNMYDLGDPTGAMRKLIGLGGYMPRLDATVFTVPPTPERMAHETLHRLQMENFPTRAAGTAAWNPRGPGELAYLDAPGEQQAYKVEELLGRSRPRGASGSAAGSR
jgi:hypothetical protein